MKAVLNYFVHKAFAPLRERLLAIQSNIQAVYEWLHGRLSADHMPRRMPIVERKDASSAAYRVLDLNTDNLLRHLHLLDGRKISNCYANGTPADDGLPDGVSLARLLCDSTLSLTELIDDNVGWVLDKSVNLANFSAVKSLSLGCKEIDARKVGVLPTTLEHIEFPLLESYFLESGDLRPIFINNNPNIVELNFPNAVEIDSGFSYDSANSGTFIGNCPALKKVSFSKLKSFGYAKGLSSSKDGMYCCLIHSCESLEEVYLPSYSGYQNWRIVRNVPNLKKLVIGHITSGVYSLYGLTDYPFDSCVNLIHLEIKGCVVSLDLRSWNPTNVLADEELTEQFLSNFQTYIADRVKDKTGKVTLTLTLSSAVYAVLEAQEGQTILATLANKNWNVAQA